MDYQEKKEPPRQNYFLRHWRGDLSLSRTYWINCVLASVFFGLVSNILVKPIANTFDPSKASLFTLFSSIFLLTFAIWQIVGLWRSASKYKAGGGSKLWYGIAKTLALFGAISSFLIVKNNLIPAAFESFTILTGDKKIPPYKITVLPGGNDIEFRGGIRTGSSKELEKILNSVPLAKVLHIESSGGRIYEAFQIAGFIRKRNMSTYTAEKCQSAATIVLLAGKERVIAEGAKVGFHSASFPGISEEYKEECNKYLRFIMEKGNVSAPFIKKVLSTESDNMWYPTFKEMLDAGVVTSKTYGERFASSYGLLNDVQKDKVLQLAKESPAFNILSKTYPKETKQAYDDCLSALQNGKSEGESLIFIYRLQGKAFQNCLGSVSDKTIVDVRDCFIKIFNNNMYKNSEGCILLITGAPINASRLLSESDSKALSEIMCNVIVDGYNKSKVQIDTVAADQDMGIIVDSLKNEFGEDLQLLKNNKLWKDNSLKICKIFLALLENTKTLPLDRQSNVLRRLLVSD